MSVANMIDRPSDLGYIHPVFRRNYVTGGRHAWFYPQHPATIGGVCCVLWGGAHPMVVTSHISGGHDSADCAEVLRVGWTTAGSLSAVVWNWVVHISWLNWSKNGWPPILSWEFDFAIKNWDVIIRHRWRYFLHDWDSWMNRQLNVKIFGCMSCPTMDHRGVMMVVLKENPCPWRVSIVLAMDAAERWTFTTFHNACGKHRADLAQRKI